MAFSVVQICNIALARIGIGQPIAALTESSQPAVMCSLFYEPMRDLLLNDFQWPFATKYRELALVAEEPNDDWSFSYRYPTDCLNIRRIINFANRASVFNGLVFPSPIGSESNFQPMRVPYDLGNDAQGKLIFSNESDAVIEYTAAVTDVSLFTPSFASLLAWKLAQEIARPLARSEDIRVAARNEYEREYIHATATALKETREFPNPDSEFIRAMQ
jgi:hypothetical protein